MGLSHLEILKTVITEVIFLGICNIIGNFILHQYTVKK